MEQLAEGSFADRAITSDRSKFIQNKKNRVSVTNVVDPHNFYCVRYIKMPSLRKMTENLKAMESELKPVNCETLIRGDAVLMQDAERCWFRTRVQFVDAAKKIVQGMFMDTGVRHAAPFDNVRQLPDEYTTQAPFAFQCALDGCHPPNGKWSLEDKKFFEKLCYRKASYALHMVNCEAFTVYGDLLDLTGSGEFSMCETMIINGHATLSAIMDDDEDIVTEGFHEWVEVGRSD